MRSVESTLVLGLDIGGTSSRAQVRDLSGPLLGVGEAGGGNPNSHPPERAVEQVAVAARSALSEVAPESVRAGVLGMAGASKMSDPLIAELFEHAWPALGLSCPMRVVTDCEVAFAAGAPEPAGTVLIAGTGAIAGRIEQHRLVATADGYGWLLGDEGSAFWLGREAVRATLRALEPREPHRDDLVSGVLDALGEGAAESAPDLRKRVITAVNATPPIRLAELAPLVTSTARSGVPAAVDIVRRGASLLAGTAEATRESGDTGPIVLAGSLVTAGNPMGDALRAELAARTPTESRTAGPGAAGAAWLAALELLGDTSPTPEELHERMLRT